MRAPVTAITYTVVYRVPVQAVAVIDPAANELSTKSMQHRSASGSAGDVNIPVKCGGFAFDSLQIIILEIVYLLCRGEREIARKLNPSDRRTGGAVSAELNPIMRDKDMSRACTGEKRAA